MSARLRPFAAPRRPCGACAEHGGHGQSGRLATGRRFLPPGRQRLREAREKRCPVWDPSSSWAMSSPCRSGIHWRPRLEPCGEFGGLSGPGWCKGCSLYVDEAHWGGVTPLAVQGIAGHRLWLPKIETQMPLWIYTLMKVIASNWTPVNQPVMYLIASNYISLFWRNSNWIYELDNRNLLC